MGLAQNLVEGFAGAAGADDVVQRIEKQKADRRSTQKEELQANTDQIFSDLKGLQQRKLQLNPQSPTYQKDAAEIDASMQKAQQAFHDLYHPAKNPGALEHLGGFIKNHFPGHPKVAPHIPQTPGQAKESMQQTMAGLDSAASTPAPAQNPYLLKKQQLIEAGLSEQDADKALRVTMGVEGKPGVVKPEPPAGKATPEPKPVHQTADERKRADFAEWKKDHPTYKGTFEDWSYDRTHHPKLAAPAKPERLSSAQNKAQSTLLDAKRLSRIADDVEKKPDDAVNQKRLAVALERVSAGRFTTQALDYIIKAGWGNTVEQWINNPSTGALPKDIVRQLVEGAHQNEDAAQYALDEAMKLPTSVPKTPADAKKSMSKPSQSTQPIVVSPEDMK